MVYGSASSSYGASGQGRGSHGGRATYGAAQTQAAPPRNPPPALGPDCAKYFIGGLAHETTQEQMQEAFEAYGTIVDCMVMWGKGFGFVTFQGPHTLQAGDAPMVNGKVPAPLTFPPPPLPRLLSK